MQVRHFDRLLPVFACFALSPLSLLPLELSANDVIEEIVVTADYRGRRLADLPSSASILDQQFIREAAVQHFEELIYAVPNMNWSGDGHRARYLQIRGIGELEQYEGAPNPSVGLLIDDIDFSGIGTIATLFDVRSIEILRGGQGSRYGANALAGIVYVQSEQPGPEWDGLARVTAGADDALGVGLALGGPLSDTWGARISAQTYRSNGFRNNRFLGRDDTHNRDETTARVKFTWDPESDWAFEFASIYADVDDGYDAFAIDNSLATLSDKPGRDAQRSAGFSARASWEGSAYYELVSISSVADSDIRFSFDADWGNDEEWAPFTYDFISENERERQTASQEIRLLSRPDGRLFDTADWLLGIYYSRMRDGLHTRNQGSYYDPIWDFALELDDRYSGDYEANTWALYSQLDMEVGTQGRVSAGWRLERRDSDYADSRGLVLNPGETMAGGELSYHRTIDDSVSAYVNLSRSFKAGGFNLGVVPEGRRNFDREYLWNLEAGIKAEWFEDTLRFNGAVFYSRREDQQVRTSYQLVPNDPASFVFFTANAARGATRGAEAEITWLASERLSLFANLGLLDAEFKEFVTPTGDLSGRDQAHAPNYSLAAGATYRHGNGLFARIDAIARDAFYFDVSHQQRSSAYRLVNVRLGYEAVDWSLEFWVRNLFDENYAVRGFYFGNEPPDFPNELYTRQGDPRQAGITFEKRF